MARQEGLSLNQFITLAVAEKIVRMEPSRLEAPVPPSARIAPGSTAEVHGALEREAQSKFNAPGGFGSNRLSNG